MGILTKEQADCVEAVAVRGESVDIHAYAGTGKTHTLVECIKAYVDKDNQKLRDKLNWVGENGNGGKPILVTMFGKAASNSFKERVGELPKVVVKTTFSLAWAACGEKYKHKLFEKDNGRYNFNAQRKISLLMLVNKFDLVDVFFNLKNDEISNLRAKSQAQYIFTALKEYQTSTTSDVVTFITGYVKALVDVNAPESEFLSDLLVKTAPKLWQYMSDVTDDFPASSQTYFKQWSLSMPDLAQYSMIVLDEAQDTDPLFEEILGRYHSNGGQLVIVGDTLQSIFAFRKAVDAMSNLGLLINNPFYLTQSFRFGNDIAETANVMLERMLPFFGKEHSPKLKGLDSLTGEVVSNLTSLSDKYVILCRTNAGVVKAAIETFEKDNTKVIFINGNIEEIISGLESAYFLFNREVERVTHIKWVSYTSYENATELIENNEELEGKMILSLIDKWADETPAKISALRALKYTNRINADVEIITSHKAKGMEWANVLLYSDFWCFFSDKKSSKIMTCKNVQEVNLLYVAITRATSSLFMNKSLLQILHLSSNELEKIMKNTAEFVAASNPVSVSLPSLSSPTSVAMPISSIDCAQDCKTCSKYEPNETEELNKKYGLCAGKGTQTEVGVEFHYPEPEPELVISACSKPVTLPILRDDKFSVEDLEPEMPQLKTKKSIQRPISFLNKALQQFVIIIALVKNKNFCFSQGGFFVVTRQSLDCDCREWGGQYFTFLASRQEEARKKLQEIEHLIMHQILEHLGFNVQSQMNDQMNDLFFVEGHTRGLYFNETLDLLPTFSKLTDCDNVDIVAVVQEKPTPIPVIEDVEELNVENENLAQGCISSLEEKLQCQVLAMQNFQASVEARLSELESQNRELRQKNDVLERRLNSFIENSLPDFPNQGCQNIPNSTTSTQVPTTLPVTIISSSADMVLMNFMFAFYFVCLLLFVIPKRSEILGNDSQPVVLPTLPASLPQPATPAQRVQFLMYLFSEVDEQEERERSLDDASGLMLQSVVLPALSFQPEASPLENTYLIIAMNEDHVHSGIWVKSEKGFLTYLAETLNGAETAIQSTHHSENEKSTLLASLEELEKENDSLVIESGCHSEQPVVLPTLPASLPQPATPTQYAQEPLDSVIAKMKKERGEIKIRDFILNKPQAFVGRDQYLGATDMVGIFTYSLLVNDELRKACLDKYADIYPVYFRDEDTLLAALPRYKNALDIYQEKTGIGNTAIPKSIGDSFLMGHLFEPVVASVTLERLGLSNKDVIGEQTEYCDGILKCHLDYEVDDDNENNFNLEITTIMSFVDWDWALSPSFFKFIQALIQMGLSGHKSTWIGACLYGNKFISHEVFFDPTLWDLVKKEAEHFWCQHIEKRQMPIAPEFLCPILAEKWGKSLKYLANADNGGILIEATPELDMVYGDFLSSQIVNKETSLEVSEKKKVIVKFLIENEASTLHFSNGDNANLRFNKNNVPSLHFSKPQEKALDV